MSTDRATDTQPAPRPNVFAGSHDIAIEELEHRKKFGLTKYGTLLQPFNGRDSLQDAIDEVYDLAVYLVTLRREIEQTEMIGDIFGKDAPLPSEEEWETLKVRLRVMRAQLEFFRDQSYQCEQPPWRRAWRERDAQGSGRVTQ